ncbi:MAG TPA: Hsp20 family protein [Candidatus Acidoferrum sp.]|nr:Hsp20 family protein [Candidatus Acidoferrum sp.]
MQNKLVIAVVSTAAVAVAGLVGWQSWNTHQLQQQVVQLQQQLQQQLQSHPGSAGAVALAQNPPAAAPSLPAIPLPQQGASPRNPQSQADPLWGDDDPFAEMERMQQQMHQHMQSLLSGMGSGMGLGKAGGSLFDMDPFQGGPGFGSSMGFGAEPDFAFKDKSDHYEIAVGIPDGSNVELNTSVHGHDLTIEGKVTSDQQDNGNGRNFRSVQTQQFARTLRLPSDADPLGIATRNDKGQVVVTVAKLANGSKQPVTMAPSTGKIVL